MKKQMKFLIFAIILTLILPLVIIGSADNTTEYILYNNDSKFSFDEYPAISIDGDVYVPSSFFIGFKSILYEYSQKYESFYFMNRDTGRYFAFSFNTKNIIVDGEYTQKSFPIINSTIYIPLDYCAGILSLKVEYKKEDSVIHTRLSDGTEALLFDELLALFTPDEPVLPDPPPVTPVDPITPPDTPTDKKSVYLLLELSSSEIVKKTVDTLRAFGERATLFFDKDTLNEIPLEIYNAIVSGNGIGICTKNESEGLEADIKEANNTLHHIANFSTRFYLAENDLTAIEGGYIACVPSIDTDDYGDLSKLNISTKIYNDALKSTDSTIKIRVTEENFNTLMALIGMFANDEQTELKVLNTSYPELK